ncbi:MAG: hypothetical protein WBK51_12440 [Polaromonas sp.]
MAAPDLSVLTAAVNFDTLNLALLAVAGLLCTVFVVLFAVAQVFAMVKGDKIFYGGRFWDPDVYDLAVDEVHRDVSRDRYVDEHSITAVALHLGFSRKDYAGKWSVDEYGGSYE